VSTFAGAGRRFYDVGMDDQSDHAAYVASIPERIRDYDWFEAFGYSPFPIDQVAEVLHAVDGMADEDNWAGIFLLKDGRFGYVTAGCDYTGWDCQAGGHGDTRATLDEVVRELCSDDDRKRLGLTLPEAK
jgi:hypothetical protein